MDILKESGAIQDREEALERIFSKIRELAQELDEFISQSFIGSAGRKPVARRLENGKFLVSFEPCEPAKEESLPKAEKAHAKFDMTTSLGPAAAPGADRRLAGLLKALEEAENAPGRMFVALKWFRDEYLPSAGLDWTQNQDERQAVLAKAIQDGWVLTGKVPNPKAPLYPTTTIRLNRQRQSGHAPASRFRPVPISGQPLSRTVLEDRGPR